MEDRDRVSLDCVTADRRAAVEGLVAGDAGAIAACVRARVPEADFKDVAQDVLVVALEQLRAGRFRADADLRTWLVAIAHRRIADYWRRRFRHARLDADLHASTDPAGRWTPQELAVLEREILGQLGGRDATICRRSVADGHSVRAIAIEFSLSPRQVWAILRQAEARLREALLDRPTT